ncbi:hypothetical protein ACJX0J_029945, partial [Zea mays]
MHNKNLSLHGMHHVVLYVINSAATCTVRLAIIIKTLVLAVTQQPYIDHRKYYGLTKFFIFFFLQSHPIHVNMWSTNMFTFSALLLIKVGLLAQLIMGLFTTDHVKSVRTYDLNLHEVRVAILFLIFCFKRVLTFFQCFGVPYLIVEDDLL